MNLRSITICKRCGHSVPSSINPSQKRVHTWTRSGDFERERRINLAQEENTLSVSICRLPNETLEQIFSLSCSENVITDVTRIPETLALSGVCTRFRSICLHLPSLWSSISIVFEDHEKSYTSDTTTLDIEDHAYYDIVRRRLETFLANSGDSLLRVRVDAFFDFDDYMRPNEGALLKTFCQSAARWYHLTLCFEAASLLSSAMHGFQFLSLASVTLHLASDRHEFSADEDIFTTKNSLFSRAPVLKSVEYGCNNGDAFPLPWAQITKLNTGEQFWVPEDNFSFGDLRRLKTWQAGSIGDFAETDEARAMEDTVFQDLTMLSLNNVLSSSEDFLVYMTAPSLVDLSFIDADLKLTSLLAFLERSSCVLTSFTVCRVKITAEGITECLKHMPKLRVLSLYDDKKSPFISTVLLNCLSSSFRSQVNATTCVALPALHDLTLGGLISEDRDAVVPMLKSWAAMPEKPSFEEGRRHFEVCLYDSLEDTHTGFVDELRLMEKEGLRVTIR